MGVITAIKRMFVPVAERRDAQVSWMALSSQAATGQVKPANVEGIATVLACVNVISSALGSLPAFVHRARADGRGRDIDFNDPLTGLIRRGPNRFQTWPDLIEWTVASTLLNGNALLEIVSDSNGRLTGLVPIPWDSVSIDMLPSGRLRYRFSELHRSIGGSTKVRVLLDSETIHLRDRSDNGLIGVSRLKRAATTLDSIGSMNEFGKHVWVNQAAPKGVLEHPERLSTEAAERLRSQWTSGYSGTLQAGKTVILEEGMKFSPISVSPGDTELLSSRRFASEEIARIFNVPPPLAGVWDHSSFTNSETAGRWFAQHTLAGWIAKIETSFTRSLLPEDRQLEIDLSGFLRGDPESRWNAHKIALENQVLTRNEVREVEGWNPLPDASAVS